MDEKLQSLVFTNENCVGCNRCIRVCSCMGACVAYEQDENGNLVSNGGRVLGITAVADTLRGAIDKAYDLTKKVSFDEGFYRNDIGARALEALK